MTHFNGTCMTTTRIPERITIRTVQAERCHLYYLKNKPRMSYEGQRRLALKRGKVWEYTFLDWWLKWQLSGRWEQRGKRSQDYCMARINDTGPYSFMNTKIITNEENIKERKYHKRNSLAPINYVNAAKCRRYRARYYEKELLRKREYGRRKRAEARAAALTSP